MTNTNTHLIMSIIGATLTLIVLVKLSLEIAIFTSKVTNDLMSTIETIVWKFRKVSPLAYIISTYGYRHIETTETIIIIELS